MVWSQQAKLVGTGAVGPFEPYGQGVSVSLSGDGNTAIVGGSADNGGAGAAWVFTRSGGVWSQQGPKPVGTGAVGNAQQGWSVSLSGDGNTAIVGGLLDNNSAGAAWVYTRLGGVWGQQGPKLVGTGAVLYTELGSSASLSGDGNTAIVGGFNDNGETGAAWVFTRSGGVWSEQGPKLVGTGAVGHAGQGVSVSLSSDGNTAIVGGTYDNDRAGAAWVYTRSGGVWSQQGPKLVGTDAVGPFGAQQGYSVSLSGDGNTAIVGGPLDNTNAGATWVFTRSGGVWSQQGTKLVGTGAVAPFGNGAEQGWSASLSGDGNTAIVGGLIDNDLAGAAWVYAKPAFAGTPGRANCFGQSVTALQGQFRGLNAAAAALGFPSVRALQNAILAFCGRIAVRYLAHYAVSRVPMPGRIDHAEMRPDRMERRMGLIPASPNFAAFGSGSASFARLRFKASSRLMTLGRAAIARGVVASPFVFASTSSRGASVG